MNYSSLLKSFEQDFEKIESYVSDKIRLEPRSVKTLNHIFNCIDLTSLNTTDSKFTIEQFCEKVSAFQLKFPGMPNVAAVCVSPLYAPVLLNKLGSLDVGRATVSGGFPLSQTFTGIKVDETRQALASGANEIDIVINVGEFLQGNYELVAAEISTIRSMMGKAHLKVILETGALPDNKSIWDASILAMEAGAHFIKTSTGKLQPAATPEAAWVMTHAIKSYHSKNNISTGFKPAGGIVSVDDALIYYSIQKQVLGEKWLNNNLFRIGASRLSNNILTELETLRGEAKEVTYF